MSIPIYERPRRVCPKCGEPILDGQRVFIRQESGVGRPVWHEDCAFSVSFSDLDEIELSAEAQCVIVAAGPAMVEQAEILLGADAESAIKHRYSDMVRWWEDGEEEGT